MILVFSYPFIVCLVFAVGFLFCMKFSPRRGYEIFQRLSTILYPCCLFALFVVLFFKSVQEMGVETLGMVFPRNFSFLVVLLIAPLVGVGIYWMELFLSTRIAQFVTAKYSQRVSSVVLHRSAIERVKQTPRLKLWVILSVLISFFEEFIWRGYAITTMRDSMGIASSLAISSVLFGINHAYFGLQPVFLKSVSGALLGAIYLITGSIWPPFLAHATFNIRLILKTP